MKSFPIWNIEQSHLSAKKPNWYSAVQTCTMRHSVDISQHHLVFFFLFLYKIFLRLVAAHTIIFNYPHFQLTNYNHYWFQTPKLIPLSIPIHSSRREAENHQITGNRLACSHLFTPFVSQHHLRKRNCFTVQFPWKAKCINEKLCFSRRVWLCYFFLF